MRKTTNSGVAPIASVTRVLIGIGVHKSNENILHRPAKRPAETYSVRSSRRRRPRCSPITSTLPPSLPATDSARVNVISNRKKGGYATTYIPWRENTSGSVKGSTRLEPTSSAKQAIRWGQIPAPPVSIAVLFQMTMRVRITLLSQYQLPGIHTTSSRVKKKTQQMRQ